MTIAVTAATGQLGRLVVAKLKAKRPASEIVALARHPAKAADLGVAVREADYSKPETLAKALAGVDTLLLISSSEIGQRAVQHRNVIEAAKKAGVKRIVYTSLLRADSTPLSLGEEHRATEADLKASGVPFTILRNGWYTENYTGSIGGALAGGAYRRRPPGRARFPPPPAPTTPTRRSPRSRARAMRARPMSSPATKPSLSRISRPKSRARAARQFRTRTCPRRTTPPLSPATACRRASPKPSRAGASTPRKAPFSTTAMRSRN